jgi:colicin import membrane protein
MSQAAIAPALAVRDEPGKRLSLVLTVAVHLALAVFLVYGIHWQTTTPEAVEVELVRAVPQPEPQAVAPPPPAPEPRPEPKVEVKPPPPPPVKPDISIKEKTKPVKPEARPRPAPADPFAEELKREERRIDERRASAAATEELARLKQAQVSAAQAQATSARNKAIASYLDKIRAKIRGNLVPPPNLRGNPEATFEVVQLPSGEIISAKLKRSSGNAALDAAIERAILRSSPLPKPDQADLFSRTLDLHFKPLEE